ncbi:MAG: YraN family protein [Acidimicrobiia bacterium]
MGVVGEALAAWFLAEHGLTVVGTNLAVGRGEIDLLARDGRRRVAVEVRTRTGGGDPIDAADHEKRRQVRRLAARIGAGRVDFIGVRLAPDHFEVHWVPGEG